MLTLITSHLYMVNSLPLDLLTDLPTFGFESNLCLLAFISFTIIQSIIYVIQHLLEPG